MRPAVVAITKGGSELARRLQDAYPGGVDLYLQKRFITKDDAGARPVGNDLSALTGRLFRKYRSIAFIMAAGVVVRLIAPHLKDKTADPAVVVLDEGGRFVVSLLSGHIGGANALATELAGLIGAKAVITTASDVRGVPAVDTMAGLLGCAIEDMKAAKDVTAALVNGEEVALYSHIDLAYVAERLGPLPDNLKLYTSIDDLLWADRAASVVITPNVLPEDELARLGRAVFLRPKVLVVGMGCNRGTSQRELAGLVGRVFRARGLSPLSIRNIATIEDKRDEAGMLGFAARRGLPVTYYTKTKLSHGPTPSGRSEAVFRNMGVYGVCEPAALISAGAKKLLVPKTKSKNTTVAVAEAALP
ncbi:MAG: cobalamin biosynthesis protein [Nitrospirae bacterium]|nr:cobalamin biosynthesis protein [Nitrospirota bacterium]